jgi:hypothetical protein
MAAGKGGSSNNQSGSQSGSYSGATTGETSGTSNGSQSGTTSTTGATSNTFSTNPNAPGGYMDAWKSLIGGDNSATNYFDQQINRGSHTLAMDQQLYPGLYKPIDDVAAQNVSSTGADQYVGNYTPFVNNTLNTSLAAYDKSAADASNALRANNAGAFGNKRFGVAQGQFAADSAVGRGQLAANIMQGGYNAALAPATADANRAFGASTTNAGNSLTAGIQNQNNQTGRQEFDVNSAYTGQQQLRGQCRERAGSHAKTRRARGRQSPDRHLRHLERQQAQPIRSATSSTACSRPARRSGTSFRHVLGNHRAGNSSGKSGGVSLG